MDLNSEYSMGKRKLELKGKVRDWMENNKRNKLDIRGGG